MNLLTRLSMRAQITMGIASVFVLAVIGIGSSIYAGRLNATNAIDIKTGWIPALENLELIKSELIQYHHLINQYLIDKDMSTEPALREKLKELNAQLEQNTKTYADTLLLYTDAEKEIGDQEKALYADYQNKRNVYFEQAMTAVSAMNQAQGNPDQQAQIYIEFSKKTQSQFLDTFAALDKILQFNFAGTGNVTDLVVNRVEQALTWMMVTLGLILVIGLTLIWHIPRHISNAVETAIAFAHSIAKGDLTQRIDTDRQDEMGRLLQSLGQMQKSLVDVVSHVRQGSSTVAAASSQIASGNHDLSSRTERQVGVLEKTASNMIDFGSTAKRNADGAQVANELAHTASSVAERGGHEVSQVVATMKGINDSSRKIADIIGVIDSIAFQTNILALNAAVEAARAGEQGRGFAVVASEVRNLASRTADSAREIKTLINDSVERVEQGSTLVDQAGATMHEVVDSIERLRQIIGGITSASHEQSHSLHEVTSAVGQMDQSTQQNAALVEQMAAAASSLQSQAEDLVKTVNVFKLPAPQHLALAH